MGGSASEKILCSKKHCQLNQWFLNSPGYNSRLISSTVIPRFDIFALLFRNRCKWHHVRLGKFWGLRNWHWVEEKKKKPERDSIGNKQGQRKKQHISPLNQQTLMSFNRALLLHEGASKAWNLRWLCFLWSWTAFTVLFYYCFACLSPDLLAYVLSWRL